MSTEQQAVVADEAIKDQKSCMSAMASYSDFDYAGHRVDKSYNKNLQVMGVRKRGNRKRHRHSKKNNTVHLPPPNVPPRPITPPSQRVQFILGDDIDLSIESHPLFCELQILQSGPIDYEWKEMARWVKFEEDVEEGGNRWSKPHVATLGLHSLFELRSCLLHGLLALEITTTSLDDLAEQIVNLLEFKKDIAKQQSTLIKNILVKRHKHHYETNRTGLPIIRSLAEIGRSASKSCSSGNHLSSHADAINKSPSLNSLRMLLPGSFGHNNNHDSSKSSKDPLVQTNNISIQPANSNSHSSQNGAVSDGQIKGNSHFFKKLTSGTEAANILVGDHKDLNNTVIVIIRLKDPVVINDLTEVPLPSRFVFIILGPEGNQGRYYEIGRAMATLMCDEVFHDVAYKARDRSDILAGFDEFLDSVTVLPPGEWDPSIRIEPPQFVPPQHSRISNSKQNPKSQADSFEEEEKERELSGLKRSGRFFGGFLNDLKRKKPWYLSDFKDAFAAQCLASFFFLYFACLTPIITFGGLLAAETGSRMAAMESLLSGAIVGIAYALFSGQPLTILGVTGPVLVFESTVYEICGQQGWEFLPFRLWIGLWSGVILILLVAFDASAFVCYITRFTEEIFATLISLIYIVKAVKELLHIQDFYPLQTRFSNTWDPACYCIIDNNNSILYNANYNLSNSVMDDCTALYNGTIEGAGCSPPKSVPDVFLFSILLFIGTYIISVSLKEFKSAPFFPAKVRQLVSDFAVILAISTMTTVNFFIGLPVPTLDVPSEFKPTWSGRKWLIPLFGTNPWWTSIVAIIPALLCTILIFMDQQITAVIVNRKENKLKKGGGYHLDLFIVGICIVVCGVFGLPWFVAATVLSITHVYSLKVESACNAPGEKPQFLGVREQRVTHLLVFVMIGLSVFFTSILRFIPMPVLYGVFLYMGTSSLKGSQFVDRVFIMFMPQKYQPDYMYLRHVPTKRVHLFSLVQIIALGLLWLVKWKSPYSILFPIMVAAMIGVRKLLDFVFTQRELAILDDIMPESTRRKREEEQKKSSSKDSSLPMVSSGDFEIPLSSGNVLRIPVDKLRGTMKRDDSAVNISEEVPKTGTWQNINQISSNECDIAYCPQFRGTKHDALDADEQKRLSVMNEDDENMQDSDDDGGIVIKVHSATPLVSDDNTENQSESSL